MCLKEHTTSTVYSIYTLYIVLLDQYYQNKTSPLSDKEIHFKIPNEVSLACYILYCLFLLLLLLLLLLLYFEDKTFSESRVGLD